MSAKSQMVRQGLVVGMIGYASVAAFYGVFDILAGRGALYTVDLLGKAVFRGLRDPAVLSVPMSIDTTAIILYNALHLFLSLIIGIIVTALVEYSERRAALALEHADDREPAPIDADRLADRISEAEESLRDARPQNHHF